MPEEKTPSPAPDTMNGKMDEKFEQNIQPENANVPDSQQLEVETPSSPQEPPSSPEVVSQTEKILDQDQSQVPRNLEFILDIPLEVSVELGRTRMRIADILKLGQGSIIELANPAGNSLEVLINQKPIAKGEVVVVNEKYAIRLIEILSVMERIEKLK